MDRLLAAEDRIEPQCPEWAHEKQREWYDSEALTNIGLAGAQGGKTSLLPHLLMKRMVKATPLALKLKRADGLFIGPTLELLSAQAIPAFRLLWEEQLRLGRMVMGGKPKFHLSPEGSRRLFGAEIPGVIHCAYANDSSNLESLTALAAAWDETGQKENREESYDAVLRRLTVARSHGYGHLDIGTTPYEWGWLKRRLIDSADGVSVVIHNWPSWANPLVDRAEIERRRAGMPDWRWRMMYLGLYEKPAGAIYDCFGPDCIVDPPTWVTPEHPLYMGLDFGPQNTFIVNIAAERVRLKDGRWGPMTGNFVAYAEHYAGGLTAEEHIAAAQQKAHRHLDQSRAFGGNKSGEDGWRGYYSLAGLAVYPPRDGNVNVGIQYVYRLFKEGRLKISRDCPILIDQLSTYAYELDPSGLPTEKIADKAAFHGCDALRYIAAEMYETPVEIEEQILTSGSVAFYQDQAKRMGLEGWDEPSDDVEYHFD